MVHIDFNKLRFLVVDDNAHMRRILRTILHGFGARDVTEAEDGAGGFEAFTQGNPDIIFIDWVMPIFARLQPIQMSRQPGAKAHPVVPLIIMTSPTPRTRPTAAPAGATTD